MRLELTVIVSLSTWQYEQHFGACRSMTIFASLQFSSSLPGILKFRSKLLHKVNSPHTKPFPSRSLIGEDPAPVDRRSERSSRHLPEVLVCLGYLHRSPERDYAGNGVHGVVECKMARTVHKSLQQPLTALRRQRIPRYDIIIDSDISIKHRPGSISYQVLAAQELFFAS
jgi:hypothetical protein